MTSRRQLHDDAGYVALVSAIMMPVLVMLCAFAVDVARWYVEGEQQQKTADAAALAGVPFIPQDFDSARAAALSFAAKNGYPVGGNVVIQICSSVGSYSSDGATGSSCTAQNLKPSELSVRITNTIPNFFASIFGFTDQSISRSATSDFNAPAPMGSPCNTFGNEPATGSGDASEGGGPGPDGSALPTVGGFANCSTTPQFWANLQGPNTLKVQGDQHMTRRCASGNSGCSGSDNSEFHPHGYYYLVRVLRPSTVREVKLQVYDPAWINTGPTCDDLPSSITSNDMNEYASTDARSRYARGSNTFCAGDYNPGGYSGNPMLTSFGVRAPTDSGNPADGQGIRDCAMQFKGRSDAPDNRDLRQTDDLTRVFHQWVTLCTLDPSALPGIDGTTPYVDYYIQARSNVPFGGTATDSSTGGNISVGNMNVYSQTSDSSLTGVGSNPFTMRAIADDGTSGAGTKVSIAGLQNMSIFMNANQSTATFNLVRALPGAAGKYVTFSFFDPGDSSGGSFSVKLLRPTDATGSIASTANIQNCTTTGWTTSVTGCAVTGSSGAGNGRIQTIVAPVPSDYDCASSSQGGCWFRAQVTFSGTSSVTDITTWSAAIEGDLVRLTE